MGRGQSQEVSKNILYGPAQPRGARGAEKRLFKKTQNPPLGQRQAMALKIIDSYNFSGREFPRASHNLNRYLGPPSVYRPILASLTKKGLLLQYYQFDTLENYKLTPEGTLALKNFQWKYGVGNMK